MKNIVSKYGNIIASLALIVATVSANSSCVLYVHQPELPSNVKKLRKF